MRREHRLIEVWSEIENFAWKASYFSRLGASMGTKPTRKQIGSSHAGRWQKPRRSVPTCSSRYVDECTSTNNFDSVFWDNRGMKSLLHLTLTSKQKLHWFRHPIERVCSGISKDLTAQWTRQYRDEALYTLVLHRRRQQHQSIETIAKNETATLFGIGQFERHSRRVYPRAGPAIERTKKEQKVLYLNKRKTQQPRTNERKSDRVILSILK